MESLSDSVMALLVFVASVLAAFYSLLQIPRLVRIFVPEEERVVPPQSTSRGSAQKKKKN